MLIRMGRILHSVQRLHHLLVIFPVIMLRKSKRHVDPRRHPRTRPDVPVYDPPRGRHPRYIAPMRDHPAPRRLVARRPPAFQQAGPRQGCGSGAHAEEVLQLGVPAGDKVLDGRVVGLLEHAVAAAAGNEEDVEHGGVGKGVGRDDLWGEAGRLHQGHAVAHAVGRDPGRDGTSFLGDDGKRHFLASGELWMRFFLARRVCFESYFGYPYREEEIEGSPDV